MSVTLCTLFGAECHTHTLRPGLRRSDMSEMPDLSELHGRALEAVVLAQGVGVRAAGEDGPKQRVVRAAEVREPRRGLSAVSGWGVRV